MAKLKGDPILKADMLEYLDSYSDFSFEIAVLKMLRERRIECEHGGHYEDSATKKSREFDIRATKTINRARVRMAIECKNIRENFPVLISCTPRHDQESYHQIARIREPERKGSAYIANFLNQPRATVISIVDEYSLYRPKDPVGKSTVQVGRALDGAISANDSELYEKWGQSLSSIEDLVARAYWDGDENDESPGDYLSAMFPFVVVPDGRLWNVLYDNSGNRVSDPAPTDQVSCFIGRDYEMGTKLAHTTMRLTHVEIVTFNGLRSFIEKHLMTEDGMALIFPKEGILAAYNRIAERKS